MSHTNDVKRVVINSVISYTPNKDYYQILRVVACDHERRIWLCKFSVWALLWHKRFKIFA